MLLAVGARDGVLPFAGAPDAHAPLPSDRSALGLLHAEVMPTPPTVSVRPAGRPCDAVATAHRAERSSRRYPGAAHAWPSGTAGPSLTAPVWDLTSYQAPGRSSLIRRLATQPRGCRRCRAGALKAVRLDAVAN